MVAAPPVLPGESLTAGCYPVVKVDYDAGEYAVKVPDWRRTGFGSAKIYFRREWRPMGIGTGVGGQHELILIRADGVEEPFEF